MTYTPFPYKTISPAVDDGYSLGSASLRWSDGYFAHNSIHIVSTAAETGTAKDWKLQLSNDGYVQFRENGDPLWTLNTDGYIGLGSTRPTVKIDTDGYVRALGFRYLDGTQQVTAASGSSSSTTRSQTSKTTNYTAASTDGTIFATSGSGITTITLPSPSANPGSDIVIKKTDTTLIPVTVSGTSIDGYTSITLLPKESIWVQSNGAIWNILARGADTKIRMIIDESFEYIEGWSGTAAIVTSSLPSFNYYQIDESFEQSGNWPNIDYPVLFLNFYMDDSFEVADGWS